MIPRKKQEKNFSDTEIAHNKNESVLLEQEEEHAGTKSLWSILKLPWYEFLIVGLLVGATIAMFILYNQLHGNYVYGVVATSALLGLWLAFRPSEWAVDGLDNLMKYAGLTAYVAGVFSSLASNLPEAVAAGILLGKGSNQVKLGEALADPSLVIAGEELIKTAFYTTLAAAGFNAILLGIVVLVGGKKKGYIEVKKETMQAESVLLRWGFVATFLTFAIGVIEILYQIFYDLQSGIDFTTLEYIRGELPRMAAAALVISYIIYLIYLLIKGKQAKALDQIIEKQTKPTRSKLDEKMPDLKNNHNIIDSNNEEEEEKYQKSGKAVYNPYLNAPTLDHPHVSLGASVVLVLLGIAGIASGGYLLSNAVEKVLHTTDLSIGIVALIVGFSGAIPEHGIAVVAATKGKTDVALGNILGGILQMVLLIFGAFAIIVPAPIDYFMLFQIAAIAALIWFVKRSIGDDNRLTSFEGIMVIVAQAFAFILLIVEFGNLP
jgi:Ca2+/Na+ antiporter